MSQSTERTSSPAAVEVPIFRGLNAIDPPKWQGQNEDLKFINIDKSDIPRRRRKNLAKYNSYYVAMKSCYDTGIPFQHDNTPKILMRLKHVTWNANRKYGWDLRVQIKGTRLFVSKKRPIKHQ